MTTFIRTFIQIFGFLTAILVFTILVLFLASFFEKNRKNNIFSYSSGNIDSNNKIAVLNLNGPILNEPMNNLGLFFNKFEIIYVSNVEKKLKELELENINGLVVSINSPGGSVSASNNLYNLFNKFKNKSKVEIYFHTDELIASGAYWTALSGNKIYADYGSIIGSIGVKGPDWMYFKDPISISTGLIGYSVETKNGIKNFSSIAGESKDLFNPFREPTKKEIDDLQKSVNNIYEDFVNLVSKKRKIEKNFITNNIRAMVYDSKSAKNKFLIDDVLSLDLVIKRMANNLKLSKYQIIKNTNYKISIFDSFVNKILFNEQKEYNSKDYNETICNILQFEFSTMIINNKFISSC